MKRALLFAALILCAIALFWIMPSSSSLPEQADPHEQTQTQDTSMTPKSKPRYVGRATAAFVGRVINEDGKGIPDAELKLDDRIFTVKRDGSFGIFLKDAAPQQYRYFLVSAPGYAVREVRATMAAPQDPGFINITLKTGIALAGEVINGDGESIQGAVVDIFQATQDSYKSVLSAAARSDASGYFELQNLPQNAILRISDPQYADLVIKDLEAGDQPTLVMKELASFQARVVNDEGQDIDDIGLRIQASDENDLMSLGPAKVQTRQGHIKILGIHPEKRFNLTINASGYDILKLDDLSLADNDSTYTLHHADGVLRVKVQNLDGQPVKATVQILAMEKNWLGNSNDHQKMLRDAVHIQEKTGSTLIFQGLPETGNHWIHAQHPDYASKRTRISSGYLASRNTYTLTLHQPAVIFGDLDPAQFRLAGSAVLTNSQGLMIQQELQAHSFRFEDLLPGTYHLSVMARGKRPQRITMKQVRVRAGEEKEVILERDNRYTLRGRVISDDLIQEVVTVSIYGPDDVHLIDKTDTSGHFAFDGLKPGNWRVDLLAGDLPQDAEIPGVQNLKQFFIWHNNYNVVKIKDRDVEQDFKMIKRGDLTGRLRKVPESGLVKLTGSKAFAQVQGDGSFRFSQLPPLTYTLAAAQEDGGDGVLLSKPFKMPAHSDLDLGLIDELDLGRLRILLDSDTQIPFNLAIYEAPRQKNAAPIRRINNAPLPIEVQVPTGTLIVEPTASGFQVFDPPKIQVEIAADEMREIAFFGKSITFLAIRVRQGGSLPTKAILVSNEDDTIYEIERGTQLGSLEHGSDWGLYLKENHLGARGLSPGSWSIQVFYEDGRNVTHEATLVAGKLATVR